MAASGMKYQLVLQWATPFPIQDIDDIVAIEDQIIDGLNEACEVDGHDFGSGDANIFVHTDNPERVFSALKTLLASKSLLAHTRAAYRAFDTDNYTILWPVGLKSFSIK
jgi:hypothetical protein